MKILRFLVACIALAVPLSAHAQFFDIGGNGTPSIGAPSAGGTSTDNAIVRWDGTTASAVQDSGVTISDTNVLTAGTTTFQADPVNGNVQIGTSGAGAFGYKLIVTKASADSSGAVGLVRLTSKNDTGVTSATELNDINYSGGSKTWLVGSVTNQRSWRIGQMTINATAGTDVFGTSSTLSVSGPTICGTNIACTTVIGVDVNSASGTSTNGGTAPTTAIGVRITTPAGGTTNRALLVGNMDLTANTISTTSSSLTISPVAGSGTTITKAVAVSGAIPLLTLTGVADTGLTTATEIPTLYINGGVATRTFADGTIANQREVRITQPTYNFTTAGTITNAATIGVAGAPVKGAAATVTSTSGILISAGAVGAATNSYGIFINQQSGATNNHELALSSAAPSAIFIDTTGSAHDFQVLADANTINIKSDSGSDGTFETTALALTSAGAGTFADDLTVTGGDIITGTGVTTNVIATTTTAAINIATGLTTGALAIGTASSTSTLALGGGAGSGIITLGSATRTTNIAGPLTYTSINRSFYIPAGAMTPSTTSGCAALATREIASGQADVHYFACDAAADEAVQAEFKLPAGYNSSTITATFYWIEGAGASAHAAIWGAQCLATATAASWNTAYGSAQTVTSTGATSNNLYVSAATSAITIAGTPAPAKVISCRFYRDADAGGDTLDIDAQLIGVKIDYTSTTEAE